MKYFTIEELTRSATALKLGIENTPGAAEHDNLTMLVNNVLDPVREAWGNSIKVNSGYRCPALNAAVRGSRSSHHLQGMAADITAGSRAQNGRLFQMIRQSKLTWTQLIWEYGDDTGPDWIHISYNRRDPRCEIKRIRRK